MREVLLFEGGVSSEGFCRVFEHVVDGVVHHVVDTRDMHRALCAKDIKLRRWARLAFDRCDISAAEYWDVVIDDLEPAPNYPNFGSKKPVIADWAGSVALGMPSEGVFGAAGDNYGQNLAELNSPRRKRGRRPRCYLVTFRAAIVIAGREHTPVGALMMNYLVDALERSARMASERRVSDLVGGFERRVLAEMEGRMAAFEARAAEAVDAIEGRMAVAASDAVRSVLPVSVAAAVAVALPPAIARALPEALPDFVASSLPVLVHSVMRGVRPKVVGGDSQISFLRFLAARGVAEPLRMAMGFRAMEGGVVRLGMGVSFPLRAAGSDELDGDVLYELAGLDQWWQSDGIALWIEMDREGARVGLSKQPASEAALRGLAGSGASYEQARWRDGPVDPPV